MDRWMNKLMDGWIDGGKDGGVEWLRRREGGRPCEQDLMGQTEEVF